MEPFGRLLLAGSAGVAARARDPQDKRAAGARPASDKSARPRAGRAAGRYRVDPLGDGAPGRSRLRRRMGARPKRRAPAPEHRTGTAPPVAPAAPGRRPAASHDPDTVLRDGPQLEPAEVLRRPPAPVECCALGAGGPPVVASGGVHDLAGTVRRIAGSVRLGPRGWVSIPGGPRTCAGWVPPGVPARAGRAAAPADVVAALGPAIGPDRAGNASPGRSSTPRTHTAPTPCGVGAVGTRRRAAPAGEPWRITLPLRVGWPSAAPHRASVTSPSGARRKPQADAF